MSRTNSTGDNRQGPCSKRGVPEGDSCFQEMKRGNAIKHDVDGVSDVRGEIEDGLLAKCSEKENS